MDLQPEQLVEQLEPWLQNKDIQYDWESSILALYRDLEFQITRSDQKSQLVLSTSAILSVIVVSFGGLEEGEYLSLSGDATTLAATICYILALCLLIASVGLALSASFPRLKRGQQRNLYFVPDILAFSAEEYADTFLNLSRHDISREILQQVHGKASVLARKYQYVQLSMMSLMAAVVLLGVGELFLILGGRG